MPVPTHFRFVFRGIYEGTPEQWSFSCKFERNLTAQPDLNVSAIHEDQVTTAVDTFFNTAAAGIPSLVVLTDWRAYSIGSDGLAQGDILRHDMTDTSVRGAVLNVYPPQIAAVVTTVGPDRGRAQFGRFYLPTALPLSNTDMRMTDTVATNAMEATSTFLKDVSNAIDVPLSLTSVGGVNISAAGAGKQQVIDHLEMGKVFDTLRNRRKSLLEDRVSTGHIDW